jgi:site-specific DNA-methyltransferase (adenine-specific)
MQVTDKITITNEDNMELMARYPDNYFDLAIVDPPYGIKAVQRMYKGREGYTNPKEKYKVSKASHTMKDWDNERPTIEYFKELQRVSKNQIVWGGNYFADLLPVSRGWIFWDKDVNGDFSKGELAWTSFDMALQKVLYVWDGMRQGQQVNGTACKGGNWKQGNPCNLERRDHPTQKPVALYKWLLDKYAKTKCDHKHSEAERYLCIDCNNGKVKILDTHLGSGSIAIACHDYGFELTACELDKEYYDKAIKRITNHVSQQKLF